eukprot:353415-Chlamydomonas_euryale.AAC.2
MHHWLPRMAGSDGCGPSQSSHTEDDALQQVVLGVDARKIPPAQAITLMNRRSTQHKQLS